ncbi:MAG: pyridoxamine 5'-phosphate oxidase family protein [Salinibacterium sp.]|nr:pyridoxamine 5'-phosphate oxidase family protein [Salinibacterium sp.]
MSPDACLLALESNTLGRIAIAVAGEAEIFPVNYVLHEGGIYFRTAPGSKLLGLTANPNVAFEIDGFDDITAFSVVVKGTAERLEMQSEIAAADLLELAPWAPTAKYRWVRIVPNTIGGRIFRRGPEPDRD